MSYKDTFTYKEEPDFEIGENKQNIVPGNGVILNPEIKSNSVQIKLEPIDRKEVKDEEPEVNNEELVQVTVEKPDFYADHKIKEDIVIGPVQRQGKLIDDHIKLEHVDLVEGNDEELIDVYDLQPDLYADHKIKEETVIGPMQLQGNLYDDHIKSEHADLEEGNDEEPNIYVDHKIKEDIVIGPEQLQEPVLSTTQKENTKELSQSSINPDFDTASLAFNWISHDESQSQDNSNTFQEFFCYICTIGFTSALGFKKHKKKHNINRKRKGGECRKFTCDNCKRQVSSKTALIAHLRRHCRGEQLSCEICNQQFKFKDSLKRHICIRSDGNVFLCEICNKKFKRRAYLKAHLVIHNSETPFSCDVCNKQFNYRRKLNDHLRSHCEDKPFSCNICNKKLKRMAYLKAHLAIHKREKPFSCNVCNKQFPEQYSLEKHLCTALKKTPKTIAVIHQPGFRYCLLDYNWITHNESLSQDNSNTFQEFCYICSIGFTSALGLKKHKKNHIIRERRRRKCDNCKRQVSSRATLIAHLRRHCGEKPFSCDICNKQFKFKDSLKRHICVHSGNVFSCDICDKKFKRKAYLKAHMVIHNSETPFSCDVCNKQFNYRRKLNVHLRSHCKDKPFSCDICNKKFKRMAYLKAHLDIHKREKPFSCNVCNKQFPEQYSLEKHLCTALKVGNYSRVYVRKKRVQTEVLT